MTTIIGVLVSSGAIGIFSASRGWSVLTAVAISIVVGGIIQNASRILMWP